MCKHEQCKYFGYRTCAQADNETMKMANSDIPEEIGTLPSFLQAAYSLARSGYAKRWV